MPFTTYRESIGCQTFYVVGRSDIAVGSSDCSVRATPRTTLAGDGASVVVLPIGSR